MIARAALVTLFFGQGYLIGTLWYDANQSAQLAHQIHQEEQQVQQQNEALGTVLL